MVASAKGDRFGFWLRGRTWYTCDPVTRRDVSTRCRDLEAARRWRAARERIAADPAIAVQALATFGDECRMMLDALEALGRPTADYEHRLGHWTRVLGNDCPLSDVGPAAVDAFIAQRSAEGVTNHTISKELKALVRTLRQAKRAGRYAGALEVLRPLGFTAGYVPRTRTLTLVELQVLLGELEPEERAFVVLLVAFGLRRGEAARVLPCDLDTANWVARVRGTKTAGALRDLPILEPFRPLVEAVLPYLPLGAWVRSTQYTRVLLRAAARAKLEPVTANDLRRTHATLLRNWKVDRDTARTLLGHSPKSQLLETVYDKPRPHELAARAGDLSALTVALAPIAESLQSAPKTSTSLGETRGSEPPWGPIT
jgi:integrase